jgi:hypothetical protein
MGEAAQHLTLQFLDWLAAAPRSYAEVMEAWRTSCPRLSIWEDATADGLVELDGDGGPVKLTRRGRAMLHGDVGAADRPDPPLGRA